MNSLDPHESDLESSDEFPLLLKVIRTGGRQKLRKKLSIIENKYSKISSEKKNTKTISRINSIKGKFEKIFSEYFFPFENLVVTRSSLTKNNQFEEAMSFYSSKKYPEAIKIFKKSLKDKPGDQMIFFYLGISLLAAGDYSRSSSVLKKISKNKNSLLSDHATWFLALSKIAETKIDEALAILSQVEKKSMYYRKAGNVIKKLAK